MEFLQILEHHLLDHTFWRLALPGGTSIPFSKHLLFMWLAGGLAIALFVPLAAAARAGRRSLGVGMLESFVLFIRDEVVRPNMGPHGDKYVSFFLSAFFFILFCNLLGLVPFGASATGNIAVTAGLAIVVLGMMVGAGIKEQGLVHYAQSFIPSGVPVWLVPILLPLEVLGLFSKSFALCIRLFANMIGGHIVILAFIALIFIFKSIFVAPVSVAAAIGMTFLELFVAFLQAYIFTLLSAIFIGGSVHPQH